MILVIGGAVLIGCFWLLKESQKNFSIKEYVDLSAKEWVIQGDGPDAKRRLLRLRIVERQFPDGQIQIYQQSLLQTLSGDVPLEKLIQSDGHEMFFSGFKPY
jgi:hypothetical protein